MQNITLSIGKAGIDFFIQQLLADRILALVGQLSPPDKSFHFDLFTVDGYSKAENINIQLTQGKMLGLEPVFQSIVQQPNGVFIFNLQTSGPFKAQYQWAEGYWWISCSVAVGIIVCEPGRQINNTYTYTPEFSQLYVGIPLAFSFNAAQQQWQFAAGTATTKPVVAQPNIPGDSILNNQDQGFLSSWIAPATAEALASLDYAQLINNLLGGMIGSIPDSGNLGNDIVFDFSLGDSGLLFPNNDGIQIGVKGGATYKGTSFPGAPGPALPLPVPPADNDPHHLNLFLSNYEFDALNWAFFQSGQLNAVVNADELPNPNILKVNTYVGMESALAPYKNFVMQARIVQNAAPATAFQTVYELNTTAIAALQQALPQNVYSLLDNNLQGNNYVTQSALENDLSSIGIAASYFETIEKACQSMGVVVSHDIRYTLTIQNGQPDAPEIVFDVKRTDILANLVLGIGDNQCQTLQFSFQQVNWQSTFLSSTVPNFDGNKFPATWNVVGETEYVTLLQKLGATGVPLPMMNGLQFDFANAQISLNQGYVGILANVKLKN